MMPPLSGTDGRRLVHVADVSGRRAPRPFPRYLQPRAPRRNLADDLDFMFAGPGLFGIDDPDMEAGAWPERINQMRLGDYALRPGWHEDAEDDDPDTAIEDLPHDAQQEDGI